MMANFGENRSHLKWGDRLQTDFYWPKPIEISPNEAYQRAIAPSINLDCISVAFNKRKKVGTRWKGKGGGRGGEGEGGGEGLYLDASNAMTVAPFRLHNVVTD